MDTPATPHAKPPMAMRRWQRKGLFALLSLLAAFAVFWIYRDTLTLDQLAAREMALRVWYQENPLLAVTIAGLIYLAVASLSIPVGTPLTLLYGWLFGMPLAIVLVNCMSTAGAVLAFWSSRYIFRDLVEGWLGTRLIAVERRVQQDGAFYLLALRLIPVVPFFVVNLAMGLTRIRTRTFWWVSQIGMLPATCVYVSVGASVPTLEVIVEQGVQSLVSWKLLVALAALGCMPLLMKKMVDVYQRR